MTEEFILKNARCSRSQNAIHRSFMMRAPATASINGIDGSETTVMLSILLGRSRQGETSKMMRDVGSM
jgi:hypothetical protein